MEILIKILKYVDSANLRAIRGNSVTNIKAIIKKTPSGINTWESVENRLVDWQKKNIITNIKANSDAKPWVIELKIYSPYTLDNL